MDQNTLNLLGRHLQQLRKANGSSLSQLAAAAGIAKSNLSKLEQGNGNPTIDTMWRLAIQLGVPFGTLVKPLSSSVRQTGVEVKLIEQGKDSPHVDVYWMSIAPHTLRQSEAHAPGTEETVTLISGSLKTGPSINPINLLPAQHTTFAADQPHSYETGDTWATCMVVIVYKESNL